MKGVCVIVFLVIQINCTVSQNCRLKDSCFSLTQVIKKSVGCDNQSIVNCCLRFQKSRNPDWCLTLFLKKKDHVWEFPDGENQTRLERFSTLYYVHQLITGDTAPKEIIVLLINNKTIYDVYMNNVLPSRKMSLKKIIKMNLKESKKYDTEIISYYNILKKYIDNCEKNGVLEAKKEYIKALSQNNIRWKFAYKT